MRGERYVNPVLFWLADGYRLQAQNEDGRSKCGQACVATMGANRRLGYTPRDRRSFFRSTRFHHIRAPVPAMMPGASPNMVQSASVSQLNLPI